MLLMLMLIEDVFFDMLVEIWLLLMLMLLMLLLIDEVFFDMLMEI